MDKVIRGGPVPPYVRRSRSVWIKAIFTTSVLCIFAVSALLITQLGSAPGQQAGKTSPSNGQSSSVQPGGDGSTLPDQAGYISRWQRSIIVDNTGVIFQQTEPVSAAGTIYSDLSYSRGSGWGALQAILTYGCLAAHQALWIGSARTAAVLELAR